MTINRKGNIFTKFVNSFSKEECNEMVENWLQFEQDGYIDSCLLRTKANEWIKSLSLQYGDITGTMEDIVFEITLQSFLENK